MSKNFLKPAAFAAAMLISSGAAAYDCSAPDKYVDSIKSEALTIIESDVGDAEKTAKLDGILRGVTDTEWMSKFVLGRSYNNLTPEQKAEYTKIYADYLSASYVKRFRDYNDQKISVNNTKQSNGSYMVSTTIKDEKKGNIDVTYRLNQVGDCYKVSDIIAEGVSLVQTQRQDFNSVVSRKGYDGLITLLKKKSGKAAQN